MIKLTSQLTCNAARLIAMISISMTLATGCATGADNNMETSLDTNFEVRVGENVVVLPEKIEISVLEVASDSRCGKGETCVWEGDATLRISVRINGQDFGEYNLHTNEREGAAASFGQFNVRLVTLLPPAVSGKTIPSGEYVAILRVARGFAGNDGLF